MMMMMRRMRIEPFLCMMMMDEGVVSLLGEFLSLKRLKLLIKKISSKHKLMCVSLRLINIHAMMTMMMIMHVVCVYILLFIYTAGR